MIPFFDPTTMTLYTLGIPELLLILGIILILFGPKKLPELARALGRARREYELAMSGEIKESEGEEKRESEGKKEKSEEEVLLETAKKLGIETEGKTLEEIADEILKRVKSGQS